ncbi:MAG: hypothetical protein KBC43_03175 [Bacteroidales bacterium]|nr:hypothetical protein [Bacteroidales bacterium]
MATYNLIIFGLIFAWLVFAIYYIARLYLVKDTSKYNPYIYDSIPNVFTTLGVLGTFLGIYIGLLKFDVNSITNSIPPLLEGLKTAFSTSIAGIILSLISSKVAKFVLRSVELSEPPKPTTEIAVLNKTVDILEQIKDFSEKSFNVIRESKKDFNRNFEELNKALIGESEDSISMQIVKMRNQFTEFTTDQDKHYKLLEKIQKSLGGDQETSLLVQVQKMRSEQNNYSTELKKHVEFIVESMNSNNVLISKKFEEFSELLAKNNTEALVEVMKKATEEFNAQMSELVNKLVQENFQELNNSVQRLNQWQQENKEMIQKLTDQFKQVSNEFQVTSEAIQTITDNTSKLTDDNSDLVRLIGELQEVMINDTKFKEITDKIASAVDTLKENTEAFDETTNKLNEWVKNQMNFSDSVSKLLVRLEEIDKIKDINEVFWNNTKEQLNQGVAIIKGASDRLANDLESINEEFYERLNDTLQNLDRLIQRIVENYQQ